MNRLSRRRFLAGALTIPAVAAGCGSSPTGTGGAGRSTAPVPTAIGPHAAEVTRLAASPSPDRDRRLAELSRAS